MGICFCCFQRSIFFLIVVVQLLSRVQLLATPWTVTRQASQSFTISWGLFKLMSIVSVMSSNHLILCCLLLLLPSIFPSIRVFSYDSALCIRWPKYWSFSISSVDFLKIHSTSTKRQLSIPRFYLKTRKQRQSIIK